MWILYFSGKPQSISFNNEHKWEHLGPEFVMLIFHKYSSDQKIYLILICKYSMVLQCFPRRQDWKAFSVCFSFTSVFQPHNQFLKLQVSSSLDPGTPSLSCPLLCAHCIAQTAVFSLQQVSSFLELLHPEEEEFTLFPLSSNSWSWASVTDLSLPNLSKNPVRLQKVLP